jgi:hypothetical protein
MSCLREIRRLEAPIGAAFAFAVNAVRLPEWNPLFLEVRDVEGALDRVGVAFGCAMSIAGRRLEGTAAVTEVRSQTLLRIGATWPGGGGFDWTRTYQAAGTGTLVIDELDVRLPAGMVSETDQPSVERAIERDNVLALDNFRAAVEAEATQPA